MPPRPDDCERASTSDSGPVRYRVVHRASLWKAGEPPRLVQRVVEGNPVLSLQPICDGRNGNVTTSETEKSRTRRLIFSDFFPNGQ